MLLGVYAHAKFWFVLHIQITPISPYQSVRHSESDTMRLRLASRLVLIARAGE